MHLKDRIEAKRVEQSVKDSLQILYSQDMWCSTCHSPSVTIIARTETERNRSEEAGQNLLGLVWLITIQDSRDAAQLLCCQTKSYG